MAHDNAHELENPLEKDFRHNWASSSTFLFYLTVFCFVAFVFGCSMSLFSNRYKGKPRVQVPESTQYTPKYK